MLKPLAFAALIVVAHSTAAAPYTINVSGTFQAYNSELDDPYSTNTLAYLDGMNFTGSFTLNDDPIGLEPQFYLHQIGADGEYWEIYSPYGATSLSVPGALQFTHNMTVVSVENDWFYDGSEGHVPAGNYDSIYLNGWEPGFSCSNCNPGDTGWEQGVPLITGITFGLGLDGNSNMLLGNANLGLSPTLANVLFGEMDLRQYNNGQLVGYLSTGWGPVSGSMSGLTVTPVPEPETYALMLAGLGLVGFAARRRGK